MSVRGAGWKALLASGLLMVVALGTSFWLITEDQQRRYNEDLTRQLLTAARMLREALREGWEPFDAGSVAGLVHTLRTDGASVIIISTDGRVLIDTTGVPGIADSLLQQPEARQALLVGWGEDTRRLPDNPYQSKIVAVRVGDDASTLGVVWLARPTWTIGAAWHSLGELVAAIGAIALVSSLTLAVVLTRLRARLLRRLAETAQSLSAGDLSAKAEIAGSDEYATLSAALDQTRKRLARQVETIDRQRLTLQALVDQLHEGVVVAGPDGHIALINPAAIELLNLTTTGAGDHEAMIGLPLEHVIPHYDLQQMLRGEQPAGPATGADGGATTADSDARAARRPEQEARIQVDGAEGEVHLLARVSDIALPGRARASEESQAGRMLVLTDITELTRIIRVKTDFVANASHELRTPLAAIRAAVETLLHMDPTAEAAATRRFLDTVDRHSQRLEAMVSDLLDLSRLESPTARFEPQTVSIRKELDELHARFAQRLESRKIACETQALSGTAQTVVANPHLLRLVLDNLVDNAIKFTDSGGHVRVVCTAGDGWTTLEVIDDGCGIPGADQERVFERFYQVERARSGREHGTGLGLSIVRHAAAAMNGTVTLKSKPGEGTHVTVTFPQGPHSALWSKDSPAEPAR
jgi:two-component system phosphate regulon sensor histidine kinase PhoR